MFNLGEVSDPIRLRRATESVAGGIELNGSHKTLSAVEPFLLGGDDYHSAVGSNDVQLRRAAKAGGCVKPRRRKK